MAYETILLEQRGKVMRITLNRPEALNALNFQVIRETEAAFRECSRDPDVRAVVLAGVGRAFCAGDDLKTMDTPKYPEPEDDLTRFREGYPAFMESVRRLNKPVVAQVHGFALGAGCDLVLASDFAIAAEDTRLGLVFAQRAIASGTALISTRVPYHKACELLFLGDMFSAREAERLGVVNSVVPPEDLEDAVQALADRLARGPTLTIAFMKEAINRGMDGSLGEAFDYQAQASLKSSTTEDQLEGRRAFLEKRQPDYKGR